MKNPFSPDKIKSLSKKEKEEELIMTKEFSCDLVVLGGGGSGIVAAARAAGLGKKVVLLEKAKVTGGGANFATFMRTFDSKWQADRGIKCKTIDYIRKVQDEMYWQCDPKLAANSVRATGEFVDWLMELDPSINDQVYVGKYLFPNEFDPDGPQSDNHNPRTFGRIVADTMLEQCKKLDVTILYSTKALDVEMKDGRIAAVIGEGPDGPVRVNCKACVLATGSWIRKEELVKKICPEFDLSVMEASPHLSPNYTGDGIPIAERAGAFVDYDSFCIRFMGPMTMLRNPVYQPIKAMLQSKYLICVNQDGKRYCSEPLGHMPYFEDGIVQSRQPRTLCYQIFDTACIEATQKLPPIEIDQYMLDVMGDPNINPDMAVVEEQMKNVFELHPKNVYRADSLEDLAEQLGLNTENFIKTISDYNAACEAGIDWDYAKSSDALCPLKKAPYYAVISSPGTDGAFGGVKVNGKMEAYAADQTSIVEGLYVTGDFASGRYVLIGGFKKQVLNDLSWAFASGFLAGTNAAEYLDRI